MKTELQPPVYQRPPSAQKQIDDMNDGIDNPCVVSGCDSFDFIADYSAQCKHRTGTGLDNPRAARERYNRDLAAYAQGQRWADGAEERALTRAQAARRSEIKETSQRWTRVYREPPTTRMQCFRAARNADPEARQYTYTESAEIMDVGQIPKCVGDRVTITMQDGGGVEVTICVVGVRLPGREQQYVCYASDSAFVRAFLSTLQACGGAKEASECGDLSCADCGEALPLGHDEDGVQYTSVCCARCGHRWEEIA